jgi:DNA (cytosine-5)-methyltransferase 1
MRVLSLFSGVGGLDLGLERAGMTVVGQSEIDPYACRVLAKHWPDVPNLGDITKITEADLERLGPIDLVCGGFPCTDLSVAGKQAGIHAARSGLFFDLMRVVRMVGPRYVLLENVPALLSRADWMGAVLGELAESGFDAQWDCIPAQAVGAPHRRDRVFVIAYAADADSAGLEPDDRRAIRDEQRDGPTASEGRQDQQDRTGGDGQDMAHPAGEQGRRIQQRGLSADAGAGGEDVADAECKGLEGHGTDAGQAEIAQPGHHGAWPRPGGEDVADAVHYGLDAAQHEAMQGGSGATGKQAQSPHAGTGLQGRRIGGRYSADQREAEPGMGRGSHGLSPWVHPTRRLDAWGPGWEAGIPRVAEGVKDRVGRLRALGNAVVPQVAEHVGRLIMGAA